MEKHKQLSCKICFRPMRSDHVNRHMKIHLKYTPEEASKEEIWKNLKMSKECCCRCERGGRTYGADNCSCCLAWRGCWSVWTPARPPGRPSPGTQQTLWTQLYSQVNFISGWMEFTKFMEIKNSPGVPDHSRSIVTRILPGRIGPLFLMFLNLLRLASEQVVGN